LNTFGINSLQRRRDPLFARGALAASPPAVHRARLAPPGLRLSYCKID
jgi:hypothetical protein